MLVVYKSSFNILGLADWQIRYYHLCTARQALQDGILEGRDLRLQKKKLSTDPFIMMLEF